MLQELCIALTMKIMGLGHSLYEAQCIAAVIVLQVVLLCALMGYTIRIAENGSGPGWLPRSEKDRRTFAQQGRVQSLSRSCIS
jgi:hypothetical protein